jgi:exopolysaccharide production protein ExoY
MSVNLARDTILPTTTQTLEPPQLKLAQPEPPELLTANSDSLAYAAAKRLIDVIVSTTAIIVAAPVMLGIALAVRLESKGPILFGHVRLSKNGRYFRCFKFRTMRAGAENELSNDPKLWKSYVENDYKIPIEADPRITRIGRLLRKSSLDELPQFFNVIGGSMSLVGPRPICEKEALEWYSEAEKDLLLSVRPGITGVWQVQGRSRVRYPERSEVELDGVRQRSLWHDLKVLAVSIPLVIVCRGSL